jgi:hypothetical protein
MIFACTLWLSLGATGVLARGFGDEQSTGFRADVYPSARSALRSLGERVADSLGATKGFDAARARILVAGDIDNAVADAIKRQFPNVELISSTPTTRPATGEVLVRVQLNDVRRPGAIWGSTDLESGTLAATLVAPGLKPVSPTVQFVDKTWADDWASFVNRDAAKKWILAESPRPCISEQEADEQARKAAAVELWPVVKEQLRVNAIGKTKIIVSPEFVVSEIEASLQRGTGVADSFAQRLEFPNAGRVWKKSLLIDSSKKTIDTIVYNVDKLAKAQRAQKVGTWGGTAALVAVIVLLYFFVNAVTKGYFVWRLRAFALLVAIVGILSIMAFR